MTAASPPTGLATVPDALDALARGGLVVAVDDADRAGEGDLVMAAECATAETVNFMATVGRGLICVPMPTTRLDGLQIPPAVAGTVDPGRTAFRVSVDHAALTTTGISAMDRATTIRALADPASGPGDFTRPGHVFPLGYTDGGVLARPGHIGAAVDLAVLAGLSAAGVICEICDADGRVAGLTDLVEIGRFHGLPIITIADLVEYRRAELSKVERVGTTRLPLAEGQFRGFGFVDGANREHIAIVLGDVADGTPPPVYFHRECVLGDVFGSLRCDCHSRWADALSCVARNGRGALIYLREPEGRGRGLTASLTALARRDAEPHGAVADPGHTLSPGDYRTACEILASLGIRQFRRISGGSDSQLAGAPARAVEPESILAPGGSTAASPAATA